MPNKEKLTENELEFVRQYFLNNGNGTKAVEATPGFKCKYPQQYATKLLQKPLVAEAIERERQRVADAFVVKAATKKRWLVKIIEKCLGEDELAQELDDLGLPLDVLDEDYEAPKPLFLPDQAIRAIGELNKMEGDHAAVKANIGVAAGITPLDDHAGMQAFAERIETLFGRNTKADS